LWNFVRRGGDRRGPIGGLSGANAQTTTLDPITVVATKTEEKVIESLAAVSAVRDEQIRQILPKRLSDIFIATPGISFQNRGDDPSTAINLRGLQDFGRVAVVVDGARQNFQRTGHTANGAFFLDTELLAAADVVRGPTANIYGSGAIGGVVSFRTKDVEDILRPGERWGALANTQVGNNQVSGLASLFGAVRVNPNVDFIAGGSYRSQSEYRDGNNEIVPNSWNKTGSALAKATFRPADGHEVKIGGTFQDFLYDFGQPNRGALVGTSVYATEVQNTTTNARWKYGRPDDMLLNWDANVYWNRTDQKQVKVSHTSTAPNAALCGAGVSGNNITGCIGDRRGYVLDTVGFDVNNTSRVVSGNWRHAVTIGGDAFNDKVDVTDSHGNSNVTTPSGERTVSGAFLQYKLNYGSWVEMIAAGRYDNYHLEGLGTTSEGDRFSPKFTLGVTPVAGVTPYVTYAEGYRSPALTETIIAGAHATGGGPPSIVCPDGKGGLFCFLPNPNLQPEIGKTKEAGLNLKFDNVGMPGATFRGKFNVFRNDIDGYIELTNLNTGSPFYFQYQNFTKAHVEGVEFETMYDTGDWFGGVAGSFQRSRNEQTGFGLVTAVPRKITTTAGARFLDRKLTVTMWWVNAEANKDIPTTYLPGTDYNLVNLFVGYSPTPDILAGVGIDNLFNQYYRPYAVPGTSANDNQRDTLWASPAPGVTFKGSVKIRFGAT
jgi:hemoglobin/transferrin/lactoferrin receptor protein